MSAKRGSQSVKQPVKRAKKREKKVTQPRARVYVISDGSSTDGDFDSNHQESDEPVE